MNRVKFLIGAIVGVAALALAGSATAAAQCATSPNGSYGYAYSGLLQIGHGPSMANFQPTATSGKITFNKDGTLSGHQTDNSGGTVFSVDLEGTFTVNDDCTGTMERKFMMNGYVTLVVHENFTVVNGGNEVKFIRTDPAFFMVQGSMTKQ